MNRKKEIPGKGSRALSCALGLLLTLMLWLTVEVLLFGHILLSGTVYDLTTQEAGVVEAHLSEIREEVSILAQEKGFDADAVMEKITPEGLKALNHETGEWLRQAIRTGNFEETPAFATEEIREVLEADEGLARHVSPDMLDREIDEIAVSIRATVTSKSLAFREILLRAAVKIVSRRVSVPALSAVAQRLPQIMGMICLILAGLIVLLNGKKAVLSLHYIGAAMTACAMLLVLTLGVIPLTAIGGLLGEISDMVKREYHLLMIILSAETILAAAVMAVLGRLGMNMAKKAGAAAEAVAGTEAGVDTKAEADTKAGESTEAGAAAETGTAAEAGKIPEEMKNRETEEKTGR